MKKIFILILAAAFVLSIIMPVSAAVQEVTVKGQLSTLSQSTNTITIGHPLQYGCAYPTNGATVCSYTPMDTEALTGTVPDVAAFSVFNNGDNVVATSIGGAGTTWITLAKLYGSRPNEEFITDIIGYPSTIPTPLIGNYSLDISATADCTKCVGTVCTASSSVVIINSDGIAVARNNLTPGQAFTFNGRNDGSNVTVIFVKGQAGYQDCAGQTPMTGPQPVSVYIVKVVPPLNMAQNNIRTATTTSLAEALTPGASATATNVPLQTTTVPGTAATQKSGPLPFAAIGALGIMALAAFRRQK